MKLVRYSVNGRSPQVGLVKNNSVIDLSAIVPSMQAIIALSADGLAVVQQHAAQSSGIPLANVTLHAPLLPQRNVMCLGRNYVEHARESFAAVGEAFSLSDVPLVFTKATTAVSGPTSPIPFDPKVSEKIDWEVELAIIIGKQGKKHSG